VFLRFDWQQLFCRYTAFAARLLLLIFSQISASQEDFHLTDIDQYLSCNNAPNCTIPESSWMRPVGTGRKRKSLLFLTYRRFSRCNIAWQF
jgi:hypothetical protein